MSCDPENLWTEAEDNAVRLFYPRHGMRWVGWAEVLSRRTLRAIRARAMRLGVKGPPRPKRKHPKPDRKKPEGDQRHYKVRTELVPDPYEDEVMDCMGMGMTPSEIDASKHWRRGTAKMILTYRWGRENA